MRSSGADPAGRVRLHIRVRGPRRGCRVVHRVGSAAGIHRDRRRVAIGVSQYISFLVQAVGLDHPVWTLGAPRTGHGHRVDLFAVLLCLGVAWLLNRGIKSSARVETWLVFVKIAIVIAVIAVGVFYIDTDNLTPYLPYGFSGVATGAATVF